MAVLLGSLGLFVVTAAAGAPPKAKTKVLLMGVDAGEWDVLGPLMDQGRCPNFAHMRAQGSAGKLRSFVPLARSPVIWASIATGKVPAKHGIQDFFARRSEADIDRMSDEVVKPEAKPRPITSNLWKARPIWDILSGLNRTVDVVGWWTTWPARPVNGVMVTDYVQYQERWADSKPNLTYPDSLGPMVRRLRRTPESVSWAEIFQFVAPFDTTHVTARQEELVHNLKWVYASDLTFHRVSMELYRRMRPDFFSVYFRGVDEICHIYWDLSQLNSQFDRPLTKDEVAWIKPLIPNYYVFTDRLLGDLLKQAGKDTDVIVCSDHGYGGGGMGVMAHKPDGIIFMMGPHIVKGGTITGANVLDVTPSILALFGLPTARDMDGRPISGGVDPKLVQRMERETRLPTYETARAPGTGEEPVRSPVDDELLERLRSLGYIQ
jgi:predicted AlkP superfamily phosphohydrolase/phosphomutase